MMKAVKRVGTFAVIGGLAIGLYLGSLFKGFGWGTGEKTVSPGSSSKSTTQTSPLSPAKRPDPATEKPTRPDDAQPEAKPTPSAAPVRPWVDVLISDRRYLLRDRQGEFATSAGLSEIIEQAKRAAGNDDGVRVRIYRARSSRANTENSLLKALRDAELPEASIEWMPGIVDGDTDDRNLPGLR